MKLYVELNYFNVRQNFVTMEAFFYLFEIKQWVEMGNIYEDAYGSFVILL